MIGLTGNDSREEVKRRDESEHTKIKRHDSFWLQWTATESLR